jgi:four helix bundle protein
VERNVLYRRVRRAFGWKICKFIQKAVVAADAIFALTEKPAFERHLELRRQMRSSSGRIQSHLQEGAGQGTDRHYAHYVGIARGSSKEMKGHFDERSDTDSSPNMNTSSTGKYRRDRRDVDRSQESP